ncbi:expressed unknown protein [Ectocarpus siliculosus]|uniref:Uncharacterized protein n=1 Tax=Ectocarpus siliculosus TaxID=2880 RepID=D8LMZ6_ECTSI|nr:expressed unknown protein [Ectocarpus siliculosus]|eukprot:CBN76237.1 expressed unknown protein [Ectocarpus siliculosus]
MSARKDFKIYMDKLLEHSTALDTFRPDKRHSDAGDTGSGVPAWGPSLGMSEEGGSVGEARGSPPAGAAVDVTMPPFSPSRFREEKHAWPRAGAVTPPRPRPPPNFSWMAEPGSPASRRRGGGGAGGVSGGGARKSLSSADLASSPAPAAGGPRIKGGRLSADLGMDDGGRSWGAEEEEGEEDADAWKAQWSRRLSRGPIHSEYQDRFPWPPRSAFLGTVDDDAFNGAPPPPHPRGRRASARGAGSRAEGGGAGSDRRQGGSAVARGRGGSEPPRGRAAAGYPRDGGGVGGEERRRRRPSSSSVDTAAAGRGGEGSPSDGRRAGTGRLPGGDLEMAGGGGRGGGGGGRGGRGGGGAAAVVPFAAGKRGDDRKEGARQEAWRRGGSAVGSPPPSEQTSGLEVIGHRTSRASSVYDEKEWEAGRGSEADGGWPSRAADVGGSSMAGGATLIGSAGDVAAAEVWRGEAVGRGEVTTMSGGRTLDFSSQSILTEYMDEYAWPSSLPAPGRRGKRSGMGVDHVGRLLAGRRAEEPARKLPDPAVVARLGAAADRALGAGSLGHLSEMCRLKSPPLACRRLMLGLVIALGLRWRRWSDIRTHLLGNKPELQGFLKRFNKDRAGLASTALLPFVEDPSLSPAEVRRVAACMVWVPRWLHALHDYLAVKEGKELDVDTMPMFQEPATSRSRAKLARRRQSSGCRAHGTVPGTVPPDGASKGREGRRPGAGEGGSGTQPRKSGTAAAAGATAATMGLSEQKHDQGHHHGRGGTRKTRRPSRAAATRGDDSTCPPGSTPTGGDTEGGSRGEGFRYFGEGGRGGDGGKVDVDGDLESESQWTVGTVTSRGDVLRTPTEDQVDIGSSVVVGGGKGNVRKAPHKHAGGGGGGGGGRSLSSSGVPASPPRRRVRSTGDAARRAGTGTLGFEETLAPKGGRRGSVRRGLSRGDTQASHACIYRHKHKGRTPSRVANPKARRPVQAAHDPILANTRWPPPVDVPAQERTEQRSAYSLEHSFLAYD